MYQNASTCDMYQIISFCVHMLPKSIMFVLQKIQISSQIRSGISFISNVSHSLAPLCIEWKFLEGRGQGGAAQCTPLGPSLFALSPNSELLSAVTKLTLWKSVVCFSVPALENLFFHKELENKSLATANSCIRIAVYAEKWTTLRTTRDSSVFLNSWLISDTAH